MSKTITLDSFEATFYSMYSEHRQQGDCPKKPDEFGFINYLKSMFGPETIKRLEKVYQQEKKKKVKVLVHQPAYLRPLRTAS